MFILPDICVPTERAPIAEQIGEAYGLNSFDKVMAIRYTFNIPEFKLSRSWVLEPKTDTVTYEGPAFGFSGIKGATHMDVKDSREMISSPTCEQTSDDPAEQTDRALISRIADGDRYALWLFFLRHEMHVQKLLRPPGDMRESAEEAVLDTFVAVCREAQDFRGESRALIWLLGIAYRRGLAYQRREWARSNRTAAAEFGDDARARPEWLPRASMQLPFTQRAVIELAYGLGLSCEEMASVMQCAPKLVKTTLLHARRALDLASIKVARR